ncbi:MAG: SPOR domain-containing protein [Deltaproteobacteria bacterium]|nr:SPOR domain-containing protein [Deltaproteobacteria bacterium]
MSIKDTLEKQKKPVILGAAVVVLIIVLVIVFVPFGGENKAPAKPETIVKKAKITPPGEAAPVQTAKVEVPAAKTTPAAPAAKPEVKAQAAPPVKTDVKPPVMEKIPAVKETATARKTETPAMPDKKPVTTAKTETPAASGKMPVTTAKPETQAKVDKAAPSPAPPPAKAEKAVKPAEPAPPAEKTAPKAITKSWAVNTASFPYRDEAERFAKALRKAGYNVYITEFKKDDVVWQRVRVGFYRTQAEAVKAVKDIGVRFKIDTPWAVKPSKKEVERHTK